MSSSHPPHHDGCFERPSQLIDGLIRSTYYQRPLEERQADYLKVMPDLLIFKPEASVDQRKQALVEKAVLDGWSKEAIGQLREVLKDIHAMVDYDETMPKIAEVAARQNKYRPEEHIKYEVIQVKEDDEEAILKLLSRGYEFVDRVNGHRLYRRRLGRVGRAII